MKRIGGLWPRILEFDNLLLAWRRARRGKRNRSAVARFGLDLERNLFQLQEELTSHRYRPGGYRQFEIYDRKARTISAAPFRDRVVHHALMNLVEPTLDSRFIHHCYACRRGRGVHAAAERAQHWVRRYRYALKLDVSRYFPSIDHDIAKAKLARLIKDPDVLWLFGKIIDSAPANKTPLAIFPGDDLVELMQRRRGLPIGNLTSQFLGNLYLNDLDHHLYEHCGAQAYLRYVDDLILFGDNRRRLWTLRDEIDRFLAAERLQLHPHKQEIFRCRDGIDVLGYRVFAEQRRVRQGNGYRFRRRLRARAAAFARGRCSLEDVRTSVAAWIGHVQHADSHGLRRAVLGAVSFVPGDARTNGPSRAPRRLVEQQTEEPPFRQPQQERAR
mgnify:CR=1 FL=1